MNDRRIFRQHWLVKLALPGLPWFSLSVLIFVGALHLHGYSNHALWLLVFLVLPLLKLCQLCWEWLAYAVIAVAGSNVLTVRSGILNVQEDLVPLTDFTTVRYERPWWAALLGLDVADAIIGTVSGSCVLRSMGEFSDLREVIRSMGQIVPPKQPSAFAILLRSILSSLSDLISSLVSLGRSALDRLGTELGDGVRHLFGRVQQVLRRREPLTDFGFDPPPGPSSVAVRQPELATVPSDAFDGGYVYRGVPFAAQAPSDAGFWAFCQQFIIWDKNWTRWHYCAGDLSRRYYPDGIADHVAQSYLDRLRRAFILIPGPDGCSGERLSSRIHFMEDIERLIPDPLEVLDEAA